MYNKKLLSTFLLYKTLRGDANAAIRYIPEKRAIPISYKKKHIYRV